MHWHRSHAAWHILFCQQIPPALKQGTGGCPRPPPSRPAARPAPPAISTVTRGISDRGGTLVSGTFCGVGDEEIQATAQGHAGVTEGPCMEIRHSETSEAPRRLWRKENPDSELFNGSQPHPQIRACTDCLTSQMNN